MGYAFMPLIAPHTTAYGMEDELKLRTGLLKHAFYALKLGMLATVIGAAALTYGVWEHVDNTLITLWFSLIVLVSGWRFLVAHGYERRPDRHSVSGWELRFMIGIAMGGSVYGWGSYLLYVPGNFQSQAMLIIILAGMSAGAMNTLASMLNALRLYLVLLLTPIAARMMIEGGADHYFIATMVLMFMVMLFVIAQNYYDDLVKTLKSGILFEKAQRQLNLSEERFGTIFHEAPIGIFLYDTNLKIIESNEAFGKILHAPVEQLIGLDMKTLPDRRVLPAIETVLERRSGYYEGAYSSKLSGAQIYVGLRSSPLLDSDRKLVGGIGIVSDITEHMIAQEKIRHQAYYDTLTNIPNRSFLMDHLKQGVLRFKRHHTVAAVLFLDLDQFKKINDSLGHSIGDELLKETAIRLGATIREEDVVSRLGGDEFVILLPDLGYTATYAAANAEMIADKVHKALEAPFVIQGHRLNVSTSIGIAMTDAENSDPESLLKHADMAMYLAKKEGRGKTSFYQEAMDRWVKERLQLENDLRHALDEERLELYYQPVVAFEDNRIVGAEALLRWNHSERGFINPEEIISLAEETGLIESLGAWVLDTACRQLRSWRDTLPEMARFEQIAVNVSTLQFKQHGYAQQVIDTITSHGVSPSDIVLELTESVIVDQIDETAKKIERLRQFGIGVAIDDFGTGYASLYYLKKLPFTTLKIDRSFTLDLQEDADDAMLIETIIAIARKFNYRVIAEGVETPEQYRFLQRQSCQMFQGYLCSPPLPAEHFIEHFLEHMEGCPDFSG